MQLRVAVQYVLLQRRLVGNLDCRGEGVALNVTVSFKVLLGYRNLADSSRVR